MKVTSTNILDVKIIEPTVYGDERGFFMETFHEEYFISEVCNKKFVQDNHSKSKKGILRGLHLQSKNPQGKLVRVVSGEVYDVAVDLRKNSKSYGQWVGVYLSSENNKQLWVPEGFAHGFYVISPFAEFVYKCTDYYNPKFEKTLAWNDEDLNIEWPLDGEPILSPKDSVGEEFNKLDSNWSGVDVD